MLLPTAQNHYDDLEDTCDKVTKACVIVRYTKKKVIEIKNQRLGSNLTTGGRLRVKYTGFEDIKSIFLDKDTVFS